MEHGTAIEGLPAGIPIRVYKLEGNPITVNGQTLPDIRIMRRFTAADMIRFQEMTAADAVPSKVMIAMLHAATGIPSASLMTLDAYDFEKVADIVSSFLANGPTVGKTS
jgi:hypothetical protein